MNYFFKVILSNFFLNFNFYQNFSVSKPNLLENLKKMLLFKEILLEQLNQRIEDLNRQKEKD